MVVYSLSQLDQTEWMTIPSMAKANKMDARNLGRLMMQANLRCHITRCPTDLAHDKGLVVKVDHQQGTIYGFRWHHTKVFTYLNKQDCREQTVTEPHRYAEQHAYAALRGWKPASGGPMNTSGLGSRRYRYDQLDDGFRRRDASEYPMDHTQLYRDKERYVAFITEPYNWKAEDAQIVRKHMAYYMTGLVLELPDHPGFWNPPHTTLVIYTIKKTLFDDTHSHEVAATEDDLGQMCGVCHRLNISARFIRNNKAKYSAVNVVSGGRSIPGVVRLATPQDAALWNLALVHPSLRASPTP